MRRFLLPLLVLSALSVPSVAQAESCYGIIGGKRISLGAMCGDTQSSQPDTRGFLRELRKAVSSDDMALRVVDANPQGRINEGLSHCRSLQSFSSDRLAAIRERFFAERGTDATTRLIIRQTDRLAERYLCR